jgi:hypothetical protein
MKKIAYLSDSVFFDRLHMIQLGFIESRRAQDRFLFCQKAAFIFDFNFFQFRVIETRSLLK